MIKKNSITFFLFLYFTIVIIDTFAIGVANHALHQLFKPFLMPSLMLWFLVVSKNKNIWYLIALFFSFLGDIFLLFDDYFLFGVASFLLTHVFFIRIISTFITDKSFLIFVRFISPFLLFFSFIILLIYNNLGDFFIPVIVYGLVISIFGTVALTNYLQEKSKVNLLLLFGAVIFILSDSFIAINKFYQQNIIFSVLVISLYCIAQFLICKSMISKLNQ